MISAWVEATQKLILRQIFKLRKSKFWERQFFSIVTFKQICYISLLINLFIILIELKNIHWKHQIKKADANLK